MALDHYVSQVHLKQFLRLPERRLLLAVRKSNLAKFTPRPKDVCRVKDGSTNGYLTHNRAVEEFLRDIEPAYEPCLAALEGGKFDWRCREVFAGFLAYLQIYTPAALRMFEPTLRTIINRRISILEQSGQIEPFDGPETPELHGKALSELMKEGKVKLEIDLKMPQAMATTKLLDIQKTLASSDITIFTATGRTRFLTSDFPSVNLEHYHGKFAQRFIPISPTIGLLFHTHTFDENREAVGHSFVEIGDKRTKLINDEIIKAAETLVFSTYDTPWLMQRIKKFQNYRSECVVQQIGPYTVSQQRVVEFAT